MSGLDDPGRLSAHRHTGRFDSRLAQGLDRLTVLARSLFGVRIAALSLGHAGHVALESVAGAAELPASRALCAYVIADGTSLFVEDARTDPRFAGEPAVRELGLVAYAGVPLHAGGGIVGGFCLIDELPRRWSRDDLERLQDLGRVAETEIELHLAATSSRPE